MIPATATIYRYVVRGDDENAIFLVASDGMLAVVSSCGNYAFRWGAPTREFREFLLHLQSDYVAANLRHQFVGPPRRDQQNQLMGFMAKVWPHFRATLKDELVAEEVRRRLGSDGGEVERGEVLR